MSEGSRARDPLPGWLALAGVAGLAVWVFVDRHGFLTGSPYPMGVDGYWYAVQLRSILEDGRLYYMGSPLALWLLGPLAAATDPIAGAKLGAALGAAALPAVVYLLARRIAGERAIGLLAAAIIATSAGAFYLPTEFVKSAIGLPIAIAALAALGWALERPTLRRTAAPVALVVAAALCHELALVFVLVGAVAPVAVALGQRRGWSPRSFAAILAVGFALVAGSIAFLAAGRPGLGAGLFTADADWSIPALDLGHRALHFRGEPAVAGAVGLAALVIAALARRMPRLRPGVAARDRAFALGPALWAVAAAAPWLDAGDPQGLAFRIRALAFLPLALAGAAVAAAALARLPSSWRMGVLMFVTGLALVRPARYEAPVVRVEPDLARAVAAAGPVLPAGAVVVTPERHLVFMTTWYTRAPARLRPESVPRDARRRLVPLSTMSPALLRALDDARAAAGATLAAPVDLHRGNRNGLVLLTEATWEWVLARLPPEERAHYVTWPVH